MTQPQGATKAGAPAPPALRLDIVAGLTAAAVVLPKAMAYATVAGLPVAVGLYTAFIPMVIYALLGSSRVLSVSSTTTLAILAGTQLGLAIAAATLAVLIGMERLWPHSPAPLVAVGGAIAASWMFGLEALGVSTVGLIPQGFPSLTLPDLALIQQLAPGALGIALMSFTETIAAGRAFARPDDPAINANRELVATGAANLGGALFGAMPAGGGTSQTAVVRSAGGRSQKASPAPACWFSARSRASWWRSSCR